LTRGPEQEVPRSWAVAPSGVARSAAFRPRLEQRLRLRLGVGCAWVHYGRMVRKDRERPGTVAGELGDLIESSEDSARALDRWAKIWQIADVSLGWSAAVLAAVAGALGLGQIVGREGAAILALSAAGLIAGNQFLGSSARYDRNIRRRNAYEALARDARLQEAKANEQRLSDLDEVLHELLRRRVAIKDMDHQAVPAAALGRRKRSQIEG
jgi:hypothetical protein